MDHFIGEALYRHGVATYRSNGIPGCSHIVLWEVGVIIEWAFVKSYRKPVVDYFKVIGSGVAA